MPDCYRKGKDLSHGHVGVPFNRCAKCGHIICYECTAKYLESGRMVCIECSRSFVSKQYNRIAEQPWAEHYERSKSAFRYSAGTIFKLASIVTKPLRSDGNSIDYRDNRYLFDITWTDYWDRVRFALVFIGVVLAVAVIGLLYAAIAGIPRGRVLFALAATCTFWGIIAIYLQRLFAGLPRPVSQVVAYAAAFFIALLFGSWLMSLGIVGRVFDYLGW